MQVICLFVRQMTSYYYYRRNVPQPDPQMYAQCEHAHKLQRIQSNIDMKLAFITCISGYTWAAVVFRRHPIFASILTIGTGAIAIHYSYTSLQRTYLANDLRRYHHEVYWKAHLDLPVLDRVNA